MKYICNCLSKPQFKISLFNNIIVSSLPFGIFPDKPLQLANKMSAALSYQSECAYHSK